MTAPVFFRSTGKHTKDCDCFRCIPVPPKS